MKKYFFIIIFILSACHYFPDFCHGIPAAPIIHKLTQWDGTTFSAIQWGDEWSHGWETLDGYTIIFDQNTQNWNFAVTDNNGKLIPSKNVVGRDQLPMNLKIHLRPKEKELDRIRQRKMTQLSKVTKRTVTSTGTANIPVILINFKGTNSTYDTQDFETLLFSPGNKSMKDYYEEISYGVFTVSSGPAGVAGWYESKRRHNYYGRNNTNGDDRYPAKLVIEAVTAADAVVDFSDYDMDGDCYCDVVAIVHQGTGEESGGKSTDIWSHRWNLNSANYFGDGTGEYTTNDKAECGNIKINDYIIQPEILDGQIQTMGVFAHEFGHSLGLPDLYDIDNSSEGIGNWCLMAAGSWNYIDRSGDSPAHMSAWCKYFLGWVMPTRITETLTEESIEPANEVMDVYQFSPSKSSGIGEYFLIENRQLSGFDEGLPGNGLAIWHIDEKQSTNKKEYYPPFNIFGHYKVALEQADGLWHLEKNNNRGDAGDLYPGSSDNRSFNNNSTPNSKLYNGSPSNFSITAITSFGSTLTATFSVLHDAE
ncbi:MAG: M6 family metalloprotease domain-containing protein [Thermodesulfobacteriota bacterium]|nr:M6 family metalloprotease domain-containing protein [Thermodesulfobacteriota bacterium]